MKKTNHLFVSLLITLSVFTLTACDKEEDKPKGEYASGVLIVNEGSSPSGTGSISFYNPVNKTATNDIFNVVNERSLGLYTQSVTVHNNKAYIIVDNAGKIEVVNADDFKSVGVITGLALPRYMVALNDNKGYATEWIQTYPNPTINGRVAVLNLNTNTVTKTIPVGKIPEKLLIANDKLFVVNTDENTVTVINTATDVVETTITVGDAPNSLVLDANNKLWIACGGKKVYTPTWEIDEAASTAGSLVKINPSGNSIEVTLSFPSKAASVSQLISNGAKNKLYYKYDGKIYGMDASASAISTTPIISRSFYGLGVHPADNTIYGADAGNYKTNGWVIRYQATGAVIDSMQVGIAPNGFAFR